MVMFVRLLYAQLLKTSGKESNTMIKTTRMFKPLLRGAILLLAFAAVGQAAAQRVDPPKDPPPKPDPKPTVKEQCFEDGWKRFKGFKNQGDCVSFVATKGKNPPAKAPPSSAPRSKGKSSDTPPGTSSGK